MRLSPNETMRVSTHLVFLYSHSVCIHSFKRNIPFTHAFIVDIGRKCIALNLYHANALSFHFDITHRSVPISSKVARFLGSTVKIVSINILHGLQTPEDKGLGHRKGLSMARRRETMLSPPNGRYPVTM